MQLLVRAYQVRGHQLADLDPLNLHVKGNPPELDPKTYGFDENDLKRNFVIGGGLLTGFAEKGAKTEMKLEDIISNLKKTYCKCPNRLIPFSNLMTYNKALTSVLSTTISLLESNVTGSEPSWKFLNLSNTVKRRNV